MIPKGKKKHEGCMDGLTHSMFRKSAAKDVYWKFARSTGWTEDT